MRDESRDRNPARVAGPRTPVAGVVAVGTAVALSLFGDMAMYVILPVHFVELGLTALQVGLLLSANRWVRLFTNRVAETLLRRHGSRVLFPAALITGSALALAYSTAPSFAVLLILRMVWGLCWSVIRHTGVMTTIGIAGRGREARHMGIYVGLLQGGFVAGTFVAGLLFDAAGFRTAFMLAAAMSLAALPAAVAGARRRALIPEPGPRADTRQRGEGLLLARGFVASLVGAGLIMSTLGYLLRAQFGSGVQIGTLVLGITTVNGFMLGAQYLINGAGSPFFGLLIDRSGLGRSQLIWFTVAAASLLATGLLQTTAFFIPLIVVFFVGSSVSRLAVESQAAAGGARSYARLATATDLGSAIGPVLGWTGIQLSESDLVFWAGGALFAIAAGLAGAELAASAGRGRHRGRQGAPAESGREGP